MDIEAHEHTDGTPIFHHLLCKGELKNHNQYWNDVFYWDKWWFCDNINNSYV